MGQGANIEALGYEICTLLVLKEGLWRVCKEGDVMDKANLEDKLNELINELGGSSGPHHMKLAMLAKQASESQKQLQKSVDNLQDALDYLRICIKYQLFDLEATRWENDYLRKLLRESNS